jgi:hypothetical protein
VNDEAGKGRLAQDSENTTSVAGGTGCIGDAREDRTIEAGSRDIDVVGSDEPKGEPVWLAFTDGGQPIGGLRFRFYPSTSLFKIEKVVDAQCRSLEPVANVSRGDDPRTLQNWDTVRLRFDDALYNLRLGDDGTALEVNYFVRFRE